MAASKETLLRDFLAQAGMEPMADARLHMTNGKFMNFDCVDDKVGQKKGYAAVVDYGDRLVVTCYGHWSRGLNNLSGRISLRDTPLYTSAVDPAVIKASTEKAEALKLASYERMAVKASLIFAQGKTGIEHPYFEARQLATAPLRVLDDKLLVPMRDSTGKLWSLQFIQQITRGPEGQLLPERDPNNRAWRPEVIEAAKLKLDDGQPFFVKTNMEGGRMSNMYMSVRTSAHTDLSKIIIAESIGTAASISQSEGMRHPVVNAFSAYNLLEVAKALHTKYPGAHIVMAADNDLKTFAARGFNPGVKAALDAAAAVDGSVVIPPESFNDFSDSTRAGHELAEAVLIHGTVSLTSPVTDLGVTRSQTQLAGSYAAA